MNLRFTVKHEKTENEDENEGCRLTPTTHWLPATGYYLLPTSEPGFALYVVAGWRIDSRGSDAARPPFRVPGSGFRLSPGSGR